LGEESEFSQGIFERDQRFFTSQFNAYQKGSFCRRGGG
jgi:hypothetical protein